MIHLTISYKNYDKENKMSEDSKEFYSNQEATLFFSFHQKQLGFEKAKEHKKREPCLNQQDSNNRVSLKATIN